MFLFFRVPEKDTSKVGSIRQDGMCIDTLGHSSDEIVGLFTCHNAGGNQVGPWNAGALWGHRSYPLSLGCDKEIGQYNFFPR